MMVDKPREGGGDRTPANVRARVAQINIVKEKSAGCADIREKL